MAEENGVKESTFAFSADELYRLGLTFYKENEGKSLQLPYQLKIDLVALTQQAKLGSLKGANLAPLGTFDIIGKERRAAWELLGDLSKDEAKAEFTSSLLKAAPEFSSYISEKTAERVSQLEKEQEEKEKSRQHHQEQQQREQERQKEELQRRAIQDALNKQTFAQFKCYAEQQCPGNPDQQALLIKQLQEQHYYQYMQRLYQQQETSGPGDQEGLKMGIEMNGGGSELSTTHQDETGVLEEETSLVETAIDKLSLEAEKLGTEGSPLPEYQEPEEASMWTRKEINEFKETIRRDEGEAVLKIGHGETVTVRVPTHLDGRSLYWEFATDSYDIGFGLFFEWVDPEDTQVTVHISDSEDESEEYVSDEEREEGVEGDLENGGRTGLIAETGPPTSCIIPTYRRDCHEEVYAGSHNYPRQGVYQLKFDNSYSLWRSKTLYYRVYYTR